MKKTSPSTIPRKGLTGQCNRGEVGTPWKKDGKGKAATGATKNSPTRPGARGAKGRKKSPANNEEKKKSQGD